MRLLAWNGSWSTHCDKHPKAREPYQVMAVDTSLYALGGCVYLSGTVCYSGLPC